MSQSAFLKFPGFRLDPANFCQRLQFSSSSTLEKEQLNKYICDMSITELMNTNINFQHIIITTQIFGTQWDLINNDHDQI